MGRRSDGWRTGMAVAKYAFERGITTATRRPPVESARRGQPVFARAQWYRRANAPRPREDRMSIRARVTTLALLGALIATVVAPSRRSECRPSSRRARQVDRDGLHVGRQQPRGLHRQGPRARARRAGLDTASVQVTALADRGPGYDKSRGDWQTTKLYHPTAGHAGRRRAARSPTGASGTWAAPRRCATSSTWSKANYPADHYALYFWGHGWGWHPDWTMEDDSPGGGDGLNPDEVKSVCRSSASSTSSATTPATWPRSRS